MEENGKNGDWIKKLPTYSAPDKIWEGIESNLKQPNEVPGFEEALKRLPSYKAPENIWKQIESELKPSVIRRIQPYFSRIAAAVIFILALTWYFNSNTESIEYSYAVETFKQELQIADKTEDESGFELIEALCAQKTFVCKKPEFTLLKSELDELTTAAGEIKEAIGNINSQPLLMAQLKDIELERTQIINQLIVIIQNV